MGMFDDLRFKAKLPVEGFNDLLFQTKSLDCAMDYYEINEDGTIWHQEYDIEDRSDPNATGLMALAGCMTRVNKRMVQCTDFTGSIQFYQILPHKNEPGNGWIEFVALFDLGKLLVVRLVEHRPQN